MTWMDFIWRIDGKENNMSFYKFDPPANNGARIIHCSYCDCEDSEKSSLSRSNSKATGG